MKLSIITINYNNLAGLQKTISSVVAQTWKDFEWIIIDGGSNDGSKELIEKYQANLSFWCSEPDKGVYNAQNKGILRAKGEYLLFLNSGDCFNNESVLERVFCREYDADIIYGDCYFVFNTDKMLLTYPDKLTLDFFLHDTINHQSSFIRRTLFENNLYSEDFQIVSDWRHWLIFLMNDRKFVHIDEVVADFDKNGISTNEDLDRREREIVYRQLFPHWLEDFIDLLDEKKEIIRKYEDVRRYNPELDAAYNAIQKGVWRKRILRYVLKFL